MAGHLCNRPPPCRQQQQQQLPLQVTLTMASKQLCCDLDSGLTYSALAALAHPGTTITANSAGSRVLLHALAAGHGHFRALPAFNRDENIEVALEAAYKKCGYQQCVV